MTHLPRRLVELCACAAFFVSGACALCFERLWFERAGLAFGNDVWASSAVLSAFMLGLAGGHALASRFPERLRSLRAFAVLELVAAVSGAGLVVFFPVIESHFVNITASVVERARLLGACRMFGALVVFFVPSTAMGASLPALTGALSRSSSEYGKTLGYLYGANTAGGVLGVALTEQWFVPLLGLRATALVAGSAELAIGLLALAVTPWLQLNSVELIEKVHGGDQTWGRGQPDSAVTQVGAESGYSSTQAGTAIPAPIANDDQPRETGSRPTTWLVCAAAAGFCLLGLEVVWVRVLSLFVDDTSSAFAAILAIVLLGIALGGFAGGAWLSRSGAAAEQTARTAYLCGLAGLAGYLSYPSLLERLYAPEASPWRVALLASPLVLPAAIFSGVLFTQIGVNVRRAVGSDAAATGAVGAANTLGAAAGSLVAGFLFLPKLGMERALFVLLAAYGVVGIVASASAGGSRIARWVEPCAFVAFMALFPFGKVRASFIEASAGRWLRAGDRIVETRETQTATIVHVRRELGRFATSDLVLTNAYSMAANDFFARRYMKFFVYLPVALKPRVESALVLGYGLGNTAAALVDTKEVQRVDVVDTSREMLDLSRRIASRIGRSPLDDARVRIHVADARYFLRSTRESYDLITGEPPPPNMARVASLYTQEYFALVYDRLRPSGMVTYWLPTMNLGAPAVRSIVRGFCAVFADCSLWNGAAENFVLAGSRGPHTTVTDERFFEQWRDPVVEPEIRELGFEFPGQIGAAFIGDSSYLLDLTRDAEPLTDDFPKRVAVVGSRYERARLLADLRDTRAAAARFRNSAFTSEWFSQAGRRQTQQHFENQRLLNDLLFPGPTRARQVIVLDQVLWDTPLRLPALLLLGSDPDAQRALAAAPVGARDAQVFRAHELARALVARDPKTALAVARRMTDAEMPLPGLRSYVENAVIHDRDGDVVLP
jgi:predicted membrane-bound spermidine synthase